MARAVPEVVDEGDHHIPDQRAREGSEPRSGKQWMRLEPGIPERRGKHHDERLDAARADGAGPPPARLRQLVTGSQALEEHHRQAGDQDDGGYPHASGKARIAPHGMTDDYPLRQPQRYILCTSSARCVRGVCTGRRTLFFILIISPRVEMTKMKKSVPHSSVSSRRSAAARTRSGSKPSSSVTVRT